MEYCLQNVSIETPGRSQHFIINQPQQYHGRADLLVTMEAAIHALASKIFDEIFALFGVKKSEQIDPLINKLLGIGE